MSAVLFFIPLLLQLCSGYLLPVPKCKLSDSECLKNSAQMVIPLLASGIPELKAEPIDEMKLDLVKVNLAGLNLVVTDAHVKGLKKAKIEKISVDLDKKELKYAFTVDASMKGKYVASGQLLILPINGDGDIIMKIRVYIEERCVPPVLLLVEAFLRPWGSILGGGCSFSQFEVVLERAGVYIEERCVPPVLLLVEAFLRPWGSILGGGCSFSQFEVVLERAENARLDVTHQFEMAKNAEGKDIIKLKSFSFTYDVRDGAFFDLTGLFNGNTELSDAMLKFMNENWKVLTEEFGEPILRACLKVIHTNVRKVFNAHPLEEIAEV